MGSVPHRVRDQDVRAPMSATLPAPRPEESVSRFLFPSPADLGQAPVTFGTEIKSETHPLEAWSGQRRDKRAGCEPNHEEGSLYLQKKNPRRNALLSTPQGKFCPRRCPSVEVRTLPDSQVACWARGQPAPCCPRSPLGRPYQRPCSAARGPHGAHAGPTPPPTPLRSAPAAARGRRRGSPVSQRTASRRPMSDGGKWRMGWLSNQRAAAVRRTNGLRCAGRGPMFIVLWQRIGRADSPRQGQRRRSDWGSACRAGRGALPAHKGSRASGARVWDLALPACYAGEEPRGLRRLPRAHRHPSPLSATGHGTAPKRHSRSRGAARPPGSIVRGGPARNAAPAACAQSFLYLCVPAVRSPCRPAPGTLERHGSRRFELGPARRPGSPSPPRRCAPCVRSRLSP